LNRTLVVDYTSSCVYDFQIADSLGREVFTYTKNAHCLHDGMLGGATFVPGQTVAFNPAWNQTDDSGKLVAPGEYQVNASLVGVESQNAVMFTVNAPAPGQIPSSPPSQYPMILIAVAGIAAAVCAVALLAMRRRRHAPTLEGEAVVAAHGSAKFCVSCRAELPTDAKFCDNCGASQT
jgi:ribosomal protein L40E